MKKLSILLLCCLLLAACSPAKTPAAPISTTAPLPETPVLTAPATVSFILYTPSSNADGFITREAALMEPDPAQVIALLKEEGVLHGDVALNSAQLDGTELKVDVNDAFRAQLMTYGTAGEYMMIGSVVNSLLSLTGAQTVLLTVEGGMLESGHVLYDFPLEFYP